MSNWVYEFGPEFQIPSVIRDAEGIEDFSWHNDTCPSFGRELRNGQRIRIWCEHPVESERESAFAHRYTVIIDDDTYDDIIYEGEDAHEALIQMVMVISQPRETA